MARLVIDYRDPSSGASSTPVSLTLLMCSDSPLRIVITQTSHLNHAYAKLHISILILIPRLILFLSFYQFTVLSPSLFLSVQHLNHIHAGAAFTLSSLNAYLSMLRTLSLNCHHTAITKRIYTLWAYPRGLFLHYMILRDRTDAYPLSYPTHLLSHPLLSRLRKSKSNIFKIFFIVFFYCNM